MTARVEEQDRHTTAVGTARRFRELAPNDLELADPGSVLQAAVDAVCQPVGLAARSRSARRRDARPRRVRRLARSRAHPIGAAARPARTTVRCRIDADLVADAVSMIEQVVHDLPDGRATSRSIRRRRVRLPLRRDRARRGRRQHRGGARVLHGRPSPAERRDRGRGGRLRRRGRSLAGAQPGRAPPARAGPGPPGVRHPGRPRAARPDRCRSRSWRPLLPGQAETSGDAGTASALDALAAQAERIRVDGHPAPRAHPARGRSSRASSRARYGRDRGRARRSWRCRSPTASEWRPRSRPSSRCWPIRLWSTRSSRTCSPTRCATRRRRCRSRPRGSTARSGSASVTTDRACPRTSVSHLFKPITSTLATAEHGGIGLALVGRMADGDGRRRCATRAMPAAPLFVVTLPSPGEDADEIIELV